MLDASFAACADAQERRVTGVYVSDLLSDVLAHARQGDVWITLQTHVNVVAVAAMKELAAIVTIQGRKPDAETLRKAAEERVPILTTPLSTFEAAGRLYTRVGASSPS